MDGVPHVMRLYPRYITPVLKAALADTPVVCLLGDGCFQMTCGELATAQRLGLRLEPA
ncbi:MAG: hypothetical protein IIB77_10910, partial [Proteobacteria bacterium]|nr:hypothetical protein [Pseudomonadota bacterium]